MSQFDQQSGLAGEIRSLLSSEQFDLTGYTEQRAHDLMTSAFGAPLTSCNEMIKVTFVVGGGKLVRSRYPEDLPKWLVAALRGIGYSEDRSAAETFDSQGTFKQQHDTGQNLKYLIVYPRVACANAPKASADGASASAQVDESSPEYIVTACEKSTLVDIVAAKCVSYHQKKKLLKLLQDRLEKVNAIEAKLVSGAMLSAEEQTLYDSSTGADEEKIQFVSNALKEMVDNGQLTAKEKTELLKQINHNIQTVQQEIDLATAEGKPKRAEKSIAKRDAMIARKTHVEKIVTIVHRLKHSDAIRKLYMQWFPLEALEDKSRSMSLTLSDLKLLESKREMEEQMRLLEANSRGWFEEEEDFVECCRLEEKEARAAYSAKKKAEAAKKSSSSASKSMGSASAWATVGKKSGSMSSGAAKTAAKKPSAGFAGLADSDSD